MERCGRNDRVNHGAVRSCGLRWLIVLGIAVGFAAYAAPSAYAAERPGVLLSRWNAERVQTAKQQVAERLAPLWQTSLQQYGNKQRQADQAARQELAAYGRQAAEQRTALIRSRRDVLLAEISRATEAEKRRIEREFAAQTSATLAEIDAQARADAQAAAAAARETDAPAD